MYHSLDWLFREVQRILMELLNQMDGFDQTVNVKVIMATNRADTLDPALLRPGRLDRKIEFPLPDRRQKRLVFQVSGLLAAQPTCMLHTHSAGGPDTLQVVVLMHAIMRNQVNGMPQMASYECMLRTR